MSSAAKLGVFMIIILAILGYFVLKIEDVRWNQEAMTKKVTAVFDSVAGLDNKSAVRVAGVRVGKVSNIKLRDDGKAEVTLEVDRDVQLHQGASAKVANLGLLGEKYVELDPGSPAAPQITDEHVVLRGSQPASIDDVTNQVAAIAQDVKAITASLRNVMAGPTGQQRLDEIVENVRQITAETRALIAANRENVDATVGNLRVITADLRVQIPKLAASLERTADQIGGTVGENRSDVRQVVENLRGLSAELRVTADNLNSITGQVKSGKGTVGELIYSDKTGNELNKTLESVQGAGNEVKNTLGRIGRMRLDVGMTGQYYAGLKLDPVVEDVGSNTRTAVQVRLAPNPDTNHFYNVELADDPRGHRTEKVYDETVTDPNTGQQVHTVKTSIRYDNGFVASAQAGWLLDRTAVRIGLFDSTGGAGIDYRVTDRLSVTGEAFDFSKHRDDKPHLRFYGEYTLREEKARTPRIFLSSGVDNVLNNTSVIFGGGIRWRDDDLKYLLGSVPLK